ncbi:ankyrin-3-like [Strongylocentrotus purpuratus]|uniref:Uncharacterized protein n=1 Tax=Strongylocentrotus purpuratus TaxID=7668 RepID=A0A7M7PDS5_STRPU|nr:ankyrin-3-like [Strongylocentrotus purpuratus]
MTALQIAAQMGRLDVTVYLIIQGAEVNKGDNEGCTALHGAAANGHHDVTKYLIRQGAGVNKANNEAEVNEGDTEGRTALHNAAFEGHLDVTKCLIIQGADVNERDNDGVAALHKAAQEGHLEVTKYLISQGADVNERDNEGLAALRRAAQEGRLEVTKYLISQGADVNGVDNDGLAALLSAASEGHLEVTKYLVSQGAEVNKGDNKGRTALQFAAINGHLDVTKYLISQGAEVNKESNKGRTALHNAAFEGHLDVTKCLISQGAEVNKGTNEGVTALYLAAQEGQLDVTKYLISQGAEVNRGNNKCWTVLHSAAQEGHLDVAEYLISQGAEVNKGDNDVTALHSAVQEGYLGVTKYLLAQGISVNMGNRNGYTPLHVAVMKGDFDIVKVLLEEGALVDVKDANGQTPLHLSSKKGSTNCSAILAMHAKISGILDQRDDEGLTAIHLATQNGHTPVVESLVSHGASLNIQSHNGKTCLHEAIILSDHKGRKEQLKGRSKQISEDSYHHELSPEKALELVLYLLEHDAKLDVRDGEGKLPVHYATDEVIRQEIFSRLPSIEMITRYRAEEAIPLVTVFAHVGNGGKQIELADLGISMSIPPGAVQESGSCEITLTSIQDPPSIDSQGDESLACLGIRCEPPNMIFHQPVKIKIPHSAFIVNPDRVKPDIVCRSWDSVKDLPRISRNRSSSSPDEPPYCRVYKRHLELYIGHCAEWWVLISLEQQVIRHQLMCTPYIPETVERGKEIEVHLHVHADVPGMDTEVLHEEKHQSYRKAHRSVPFSITSHSGDVTVAHDCEGKMAETKLLSLQQIQNRMSHNVLLKVPPMENDTGTPFNVITITVTQSGKLGVSRSMAFVIRYEDEIKGPEFTQVIREIEGTFRNDLPDVDIQNIAEKLSIDDFYDLGVALGFQIQQLDAIEYKRLKDRQEAIHEILITWKQSQLPNQNVKEVLLSLLKSAETEAEKTKMTDIASTSDISDQDLLKLARTIKWTDFTEIGTKLGISQNKLQNIKHRTLQNRKDANIQMLCMWKASQRSGAKATKTLKCIWESVFLASAENTGNCSSLLIKKKLYDLYILFDWLFLSNVETNINLN